MTRRSKAAVVVVTATALLSAWSGSTPSTTGDLGALAKAFLDASVSTDWDGLEKLPGSRWAPLPPTSLTNCLPNGDCYARQGMVTVDGRQLAAVATGARTIVVTLLLRNQSAPFGDAAVLAALAQAGLISELARCPIRRDAGGTSWYRLKGANLVPGFLSIQPASPGRASEGLVLFRRDELPALQPNQLALYSEKCAAGVEREPVSTVLPHQAVAQSVVTLLVPAGGPLLHDWPTLRALPTGISWLGDGPKPVDTRSLGDPNPMMQSGVVTWGGRKFSVWATGTATNVKTVHIDEQGGGHPKGEHMLGVVYEKGVAVRLVRCGPVYTESTNNWYGLTSAKSRAATIRQSIHYDGSQASDAYELRLDGTLPPRDLRDRNPGVNGC